MENNINEILGDLYALDPTLKERDLDVRALISTFMEAKPEVTVDATFVANLRARLVQPSVPSPYQSPHPFEWWVFRLAPLGATLLIILMLFPNLEHTQPLTPTLTPTEETSTYSEQFAPTTGMAPTAKQAGGQTDSFSLMMDSRIASQSDSFTLGTQLPGEVVSIQEINVLQSGFVAIHTDNAGEPGALLGVSSLLSPDTRTQIFVPLTTSLVEGGTYFATLYYDDGDGVFEEQKDIPVVEPNSGIMLRAPFTVSRVTPSVK